MGEKSNYPLLFLWNNLHFLRLYVFCLKYLWLFFILCLPFVILWQKGEYFLFLDRECISKPVKCFLSHNGQMWSLFLFYVGYILDDKNTLCNSCFLNRIIGLIQNLQVLWAVFISSLVSWLNFLEDVHEDSMLNSKSAKSVPVQPSVRDFEGVRTPLSV
jgi:hypothetical protein